MKSETKVFDHAPVAMMLLKGPLFHVEMANRRFMDHWNTSSAVLIGNPLFQVIPEFANDALKTVLNNVMLTGIAESVHGLPFVINRNGRSVQVFVSSNCEAYRESDGEIMGVIVVLRDVTSEIYSNKQLEQSEFRSRALIEQAPVATALFTGPEMRVEFVNTMMLSNWGKDLSVLNKPLIEALPELEGQPFLDLLADVYASGKLYSAKAMRANLIVDGVLGIYYYDFTYKPLINDAGRVYGIINVAINVTEEVLNKRKKIESEMKLRSIIASAPAGIGLFVGRDLVIETPNKTFIDIVGKGPDIEGLPLREAMPELITEGQPFLKILDDVFTTGKMFQSVGTQVKIVQNGVMTYNYYNISYTPLLNTEGEVYAILDIAVDVTEQIKAQKKLEEVEISLRAAIEIAELGTWSIDADTSEANYSAPMMNWAGTDTECANLALIYPQVLEVDRKRIERAVTKAFESGAGGAFDERFTIVNKRTGRQRFIHALAKVIIDNERQQLRLNGTAQDITIQQQTQMALEQEVQLRTEELASAIEELRATNEELARTNDELAESNAQLLHSNDELAQYAYVASHDLQEPLRKIRFFSDILDKHNYVDEDGQVVARKIRQSAVRMSQLIQDLLTFSRLMYTDKLMQPVDLGEIFTNVENDFELTINEKQAVIQVGSLPVIEAISLQMNQLFFNLLSNALKFTAPGVPPRIRIESAIIDAADVAKHIAKPLTFTHYVQISIQDNGIGFHSQYSEQIFEVFKRLHGRNSYPGSGIGLSLCRRILNNHQGILFADSTPGKGSTFNVIIPAKHSDN